MPFSQLHQLKHCLARSVVIEAKEKERILSVSVKPYLEMTFLEFNMPKIDSKKFIYTI